jgi:hypothetical protein
MKTFLISILCVLSMVPAFSQETPVCATPSKKYINELALIFPMKTDDVKNYINGNNIAVNPLTSGFSSGFQVGKHRIINDQATLGVVLGANGFFSAGSADNQIYQFGAYLTGRLYFGDTWKNGVFAEIGAGPEFAAASIQGGDFQFQANFASRLGVGYNYQFSKDVTLGVSFITAPSLMSDNYFNGSKVVVNMLW